MGTTDLDLLKVLVASLAFGRCKFILILLPYRIKKIKSLPEALISGTINKESGPKGPGFALPPEGARILFPTCGSLLE
jgi:hypothetical protein